jgi:hypothetical protein
VLDTDLFGIIKKYIVAIDGDLFDYFLIVENPKE